MNFAYFVQSYLIFYSGLFYNSKKKLKQNRPDSTESVNGEI